MGSKSPDNRRNSGLVWGIILIALGLIALIGQFIQIELGLLMWSAALAVAGLLVAGVYLADRSQEWTLIPAYVLWAVAGLLAGIFFDLLSGGLIPTYVLFAVALPFLYVYVRNTAQNWWALIPAYVLLVIGTMITLITSGLLGDLGIPAFVNLAIALPFFVVYLRNRANWWALIPGGIMGFIGLGFLAASLVTGGAAFLSYLTPAILIVGGILLLLGQYGGRKSPTATPPATGPEADKPPRE